MLKNKITILIFSTLMTVHSLADVTIIKDSPSFINKAEKVDEVERHFYVLSPISVNELEDIKVEKEYLLSFSDLRFKTEADFPSEKNKPDININSRKLLDIDTEYKRIIKEYETVDEIEAEIRYEKSVSLMSNVYKNQKELSDIENKLEILEKKIRPLLEKEENIKHQISDEKDKIKESQERLVKYMSDFIAHKNIKTTSLKKIDLNRAKIIENNCPKEGFFPNANNSMASFYYTKISNNLCISTSIPSLSFNALSALMSDKEFIKLYEEYLIILSEGNLKIGNWSLMHSYTYRDFKTKLKETQIFTRPAIRKIEKNMGYTKSNLLVQQTRISRLIEKELDIIDEEMSEFDKGAFKRKSESSEYISFDDYTNAVNNYIYEKTIKVYNTDHRKFDSAKCESIEIEDIDAPVVIVVDYLVNNAEVFYVNQNLAFKYRFNTNYGWNTSSGVKLEEKRALISNTIPIEGYMINDIIDVTFDNIVNKVKRRK